MIAEFVYWSFAGLAIGSALLCVTRRSPVASALWLVMTLFSISALFVILEAQFIAAMQVLIYAGAIMVLFVFVIMLLNLGRERRTDRLGWIGSAVMFSVGVLIVLELWVVRGSEPSPELVLPAGTLARMAEQEGAVGMISRPLFRDYLVPFEITSVLLLAAVIGAVVLAKRRL